MTDDPTLASRRGLLTAALGGLALAAPAVIASRSRAAEAAGTVC